MKIADLDARPGLNLSVEFFPPKTDKGEENLLNEIAVIKRLKPAVCSVRYGAGGSMRGKGRRSIAVLGLHIFCLNKSYFPQVRCRDLGL